MAGLPPLLVAVLVLTLDNANAQEIEDGNVVQQHLQHTLLSSSLTLTMVVPLDENMVVMVTDSNGTHTLRPSITDQQQQKLSRPQAWEEATLQVFPKLQLRLSGGFNLTGDVHHWEPISILMEHVFVMTDCPQGRSVWNLTESEASIEFLLTDTEEEPTILATGKVPITMSFCGEDLGILCSEAQGQTTLEEVVKNCSSPGLKPFHQLRLIIRLKHNEYEILANSTLIIGQRTNARQGTPLTRAADLGNVNGSVYVTYHLLAPPVISQPLLPQKPIPSVQGTPASSLVVVLTAALVVSLMLLIVAVVCIVLLRLHPSGFLAVWVLGKPVDAHCHVVELNQGATGKVDDKVPLSRLPPLPTEAFPTALADPPEDGYDPIDDPEDDYIIPRDVKPVEVEILKQQKVIQGQVFDRDLFLPSSASSGTSHPLVISPQNPVDLHSIAYHQQSLEKKNANTSMFKQNNYENIRAVHTVGQDSVNP